MGFLGFHWQGSSSAKASPGQHRDRKTEVLLKEKERERWGDQGEGKLDATLEVMTVTVENENLCFLACSFSIRIGYCRELGQELFSLVFLLSYKNRRHLGWKRSLPAM